MSERKNYPADFKREAVRLTYEPGRTLRQVSKDLGIHPSMLHRWREALKADGDKAFPGKGRVDAGDELHRLRRELARTKEERDILKKALAFFAKQRS